MDHSECRLCDLADGECGRVISVNHCGEIGRRLLDLGFVQGMRVIRLFSGASGNPAAYYIRGAVIALRTSDASGVAVERTPPTESW